MRVPPRHPGRRRRALVHRARARPTQLDQPGTAAVGGDQTELPLSKQDRARSSSDPPVAGQGQRQSSAGGYAINHSDCRLLHPLNRVHQSRQLVANPSVRSRIVEFVKPTQVSAGAEGPTLTGDHHRSHVSRAGRIIQSVHQVITQLRVNAFRARRSVQGEGENAFVQRAQQPELDPTVGRLYIVVRQSSVTRSRIEEPDDPTDGRSRSSPSAPRTRSASTSRPASSSRACSTCPPSTCKGIRRILTVSADTELVSAPAYLRAAEHAPALNNFGSAMSIIQDELAHAHIGYRLLGDLGVDMNRLIYEREPAAFKYPYAFDVPLDSWAELVMANALYDQAGFVLLSDVHRVEHVRAVEARAREGRQGGDLPPAPRPHVGQEAVRRPGWQKRQVQAAADWMFILTLEWFGLPDERKRHGIQLEYGFKGKSNDELRQAWMAAVVPFMDEVGVDVPAHLGRGVRALGRSTARSRRAFDAETQDVAARRRADLVGGRDGALEGPRADERGLRRAPAERLPAADGGGSAPDARGGRRGRGPASCRGRGAPVARAARRRGPRDPDLGRRHGPDRLDRLPRRTSARSTSS